MSKETIWLLCDYFLREEFKAKVKYGLDNKEVQLLSKIVTALATDYTKMVKGE